MIKKLLLFFLTSSTCMTYAQTFSTGTQVLKDDLSVNIETNATTTTLTLTGPSNAWFAVGFDDNATNMFSSTDVFRTDGTTITDARTVGNQLPPADPSQDWSLTSNTVSGSVRTIIATRANNTGDSNDFVFSNSAGSMAVIWAYGASTTYGYHGGVNRGATTLGVTLGVENLEVLDFKTYPNPSADIVTVQLINDFEEANVSLYDFSGRLVKEKNINSFDNGINLEGLGSGIYLMKVRSEDKLGVRRIIKK